MKGQYSQLDLPRESQAGATLQRIGTTDLTVNYSRPSVNGRGIWSVVVPYDQIHFFDMTPDPTELPIETEAPDLTIHDGRIWHRTALAEVTGDASERCVTYLPIMDGPLKRKTSESSTPFYFHLKKLLGY